MPTLDNFGLRLRYARKLRKLDQKQLAAAAGIKQPSVSDLETGETKEPTGPVLIALSKALTVRPEWLMTGADPIEPDSTVLTQNERELLELYRGASNRWQLAIKYMAGMRHEEQQEKAGAFVLSQIFATPVSDDKLGENWTRPDKQKEPKK